MRTQRKSLRERIAARQNAEVQKSAGEARTRVAASWTIAKTLLPTAPAEIQYKLASSLLGNSTKALTVMLRQAAVNAHYTKLAEKFEKVHKVELNELCEDPSLLKKLQKEVESELKGEAKNAHAKTADENELPPVDEAAPVDGEEAPLTDEVPPTDELPAEEAPVEEGGEVEAVKDELRDKIQVLEEDVNALQNVVDDGGEELDFEEIFNQEDMEDKTDSLANEGEEGAEDDLFSPSEAEALEAGFDDNEVTNISSFFASAEGPETSSMDVLLTDKVASDEVVLPGEIGEKESKKNTPDAEEDHSDDMLFDVLQSFKPEKYDAGAKRTTEPKLETPKAASKRPIRSLGNVKVAGTKDQEALASLVFPDESQW